VNRSNQMRTIPLLKIPWHAVIQPPKGMLLDNPSASR
jgi:hypothetical protein